MVIISPNIRYGYELERLCSMFYPLEKHRTSLEDIVDEDYIKITLDYTSTEVFVNLSLCRDNITKEYRGATKLSELDNMSEELIIGHHIYKLLNKETNIEPTWGVLTGVRPVKLISTFINGDDAFLNRAVVANRLVNPKKLALALNTHKTEQKILNLSKANSFSLYVGIPFCPSRCSYCSFVSHAIDKAKHLVEPYIEKLCQEIAYTGKIAKDLNLELLTIYIGGGTPTSLSHNQLFKIMDTINKNFDLKHLLEYTVEAGRPDTITLEKLQVIKEMGADRISINPQTLIDSVLKEIGREHSSKDFIDKYKMAKNLEFKTINTDIIAGLPTDSLKGFKYTVDNILDLAPENITVHTLSFKRSSNIGQGDREQLADGYILADKMVDYSQNKITACGYNPYYLYRQQNMVGNLENTGYSKTGNEGLYNVYIMEETHTILSCGAGAGTKLKPNNNNIYRIFNHKFPYEYIDRFDEILAKKDKVLNIYNNI